MLVSALKLSIRLGHQQLGSCSEGLITGGVLDADVPQNQVGWRIQLWHSHSLHTEGSWKDGPKDVPRQRLVAEVPAPHQGECDTAGLRQLQVQSFYCEAATVPNLQQICMVVYAPGHEAVWGCVTSAGQQSCCRCSCGAAAVVR